MSASSVARVQKHATLPASLTCLVRRRQGRQIKFG